jgi:hypothetical protein
MRTTISTLVIAALTAGLAACASSQPPKTATLEARRAEGQRQVAQAEYVRMEQQREAQRRFEEAQAMERRTANATPTP